MTAVVTHVRALVAYAIAAVAFSWPLVTHLSTHLTGRPSGDTGVYVWNLWVFRHELVTQGRMPFTTTSIFSLAPGIDLSQHNYTVFADLLALPLLPIFGVVATFNLLYLAQVTLTAYAMFLLARHLVGRGLEAWLAGMVFAWSPWLVARRTEHFSLAAAAPLPIFVLCLLRADHTREVKWGIACGVTLAWAALCDPYYAVYCVLIAALYGAGRIVRITRRAGDGRGHWVRSSVNVALAVVTLVTIWIVFTGGADVRIAGVRVAMRSLYTPVLVLTILVAIRSLLWLRPSAQRVPSFTVKGLLRPLVLGGLTTTVLLSPVLYGLAVRLVEGRFVPVPTLWRSSMPGVDLLAFFIPNPNHPWARGLSEAWLSARPNGFVENVASLPLVVLVLIALAWARYGFRPRRLWVWLTILSAAVALGPFVVVGGVSTYIPAPWAVLRYVPVIDFARAPTRFVAITMLGLSIVFAEALRALLASGGWRRAAQCAVVGVVVALELCTAPRPLYSAEAPRLFQRIASDPANVRVLTIPTGFRDGLSETGGFNTETQFFQTVHQKQLIGGYLSRISTKRKDFYRGHPFLHALYVLSEGRALTVEEEASARAKARRFLRRARVGYVIVDGARASRELQEFVGSALRLEKIDSDERYDLYLPRWRTESQRLSVALRAVPAASPSASAAPDPIERDRASGSGLQAPARTNTHAFPEARSP